MAASSNRRGFVAELVARFLPPTLLVLVAISQLYWTEGRGLLTPARGGGFGLFSTVDKLAHRQVRMFWVGPEGTVHVGLPGTPENLKRLKMAASLPTESKLRGIVALMAQQGRAVEVDGEGPFPTARVEVWKRAFDQDTLQASRVLVTELQVERPR